MSSKRVGFIVNPIAGMGGSVGLKGTDGDAYFKALERGAKPVSPRRGLEFLNNIEPGNFELISAPGIMGEHIIEASKYKDKLTSIIGEIPSTTTRDDTIRIAREMKKYVDIIVFVGGDGTARDVYEAIGTSLPVIGVPSGVKIYSAVFAVNPIAAARLLNYYLEDKTTLIEREVLDIDEDAFREDKLIVKLHGYLLVPSYSSLLQSSKTIYSSLEEELVKEAIAEHIVENMEPDTPYILGPGSTVKAICRKLELNCTLLGVDVVLNRNLIVKDAWEKDLLEILEKYMEARLIITPIGGQGFLFGRGNQQISPRVLSRINPRNIIVVATENKIREIPYLIIDTGDRNLDKALEGYIKVLVGYNRFIVIRVKANIDK